MQSDRQLVAELSERGVAGLGDVVAIYGDRLHDYCWSVLRSPHDAADAVQDTLLLAAERISQLRNPDKLRPWLYAIARNECLRRMRDRSTPTDSFDELAVDDDLAAGPRQAELQRLVAEAAEGLDPRDRSVLDLQLRHGLEGDDLADALGVPTSQVYVLVSRVRERVERSLVALLVARRGRKECDDLARLLRRWDGSLSPLLRKRVARHIDGCSVCERTKAAVASPLALLASVPFVAAPPELKVRLTSHASDLAPSPAASRALVHLSSGFPRAGDAARSMPSWVRRSVGAAVIAAAVGIVAVLLGSGGSSDVVASGGGAAERSVVASPPESTTSLVTTSVPTDEPPGASAVALPDPSVTTMPPLTTRGPVGPLGGSGAVSLAPPLSEQTPTTTTASSVPTTTLPATTTTTTTPRTTTTTTATTTTIPADRDAPVIIRRGMSPSSLVESSGRGCTPTTGIVWAVVTDAGSGVASVRAVITVGNIRTSVAMTLSDQGLWQGSVGPFPRGTVIRGSAGISAEVVAVDRAGNQAITQAFAKLVPC